MAENETMRVVMNITVASATTAWEKGREYDVDAETARAWVRDRVASAAGEGASLEEIRSEKEDEFVPRASEVDPAGLTGEQEEGDARPVRTGRRKSA